MFGYIYLLIIITIIITHFLYEIIKSAAIILENYIRVLKVLFDILIYG